LETHTHTQTHAHTHTLTHTHTHTQTHAHTHTDVQYSDISPFALLCKASDPNKRKHRNVVPLPWLNGKPSE
jgi:hypothetical protein